MDLVMHICLEDFYNITTPSNVKKYPFDIQLALIYPSSIVG